MDANVLHKISMSLKSRHLEGECLNKKMIRRIITSKTGARSWLYLGPLHITQGRDSTNTHGMNFGGIECEARRNRENQIYKPALVILLVELAFIIIS